MNQPINGVVPVIPTPFLPNEDIDWESLEHLIDFAIVSGATAICLPAYGSEFYKLSDQERISIVNHAIDAAGGRITVIAQANHPAVKVATELARRFQDMGADIISIAIPRQFPATDLDLMRYCGRIADSISIPLMIQDFNPGGSTISAHFLCELHACHTNVRFAKLEEPLVMAKLHSIRSQSKNAISLLTGWGGQYLLDSLAVGSVGVMPGTAICDLFARVWRNGPNNEGKRLFADLLPYITFSLQSFELFLLMEKQILHQRGIIRHALCRDLTRTIDPVVMERAEHIIQDLMQLIPSSALPQPGR